MAVMKANVPVAVATGVICLLVGGGLGATIMSYTLGDKGPQAAAGAPEAGDDGEAKGAGAPKGPGAPKGLGGPKGGPGGGGNKAGGGGQRGPGPKAQLTTLVAKLDTLTGQSLHIDLTPEQKKQAGEALAGLAEKEELTDDEAKAKLDALLKVVEANRKTLEDSGYRWPGGPAMGAPAPLPPPNPFKVGDAANQLKGLQSRLEK